MNTVYGTFFWSPFYKKFEYSIVSRDLPNCIARFKEHNRKNGFVLQTKPKGPQIKALLTKEEIEKNYIIIESRNAQHK